MDHRKNKKGVSPLFWFYAHVYPFRVTHDMQNIPILYEEVVNNQDDGLLLLFLGNIENKFQAFFRRFF